MFGAEMMLNALLSSAGLTPDAVQGHLKTAMTFMQVQDARLTRMEAALTRLESFLAENALNNGQRLQVELPPTIEGTANAE